MRVARLGEMYKEEWTENGETRVIIFRPDLGKSFLLSLDTKTYIESATGNQSQNSENEAEATRAANEVDRAFANTISPIESKTSALPDQTIDGHICKVVEHRNKLADGSSEVITSFHARDLAGLVLRVEQESLSPTGRTKIVTERRDVQTNVTRDEFDIPSGFRKVDDLMSGY